jgi:DNA polymerase-1
MDSVIAQAKKDEFVTTWLGRKRAVAQINERNHNLAELAKRIAINTVAQGTAAEIMKLGMIHVARKLKEEDLDAYIVLQIHDEILVSVAKDQLDQVKGIVKQELESVVNWKIPLLVDIATGLNWKELE